jgi:predicted esterase
MFQLLIALVASAALAQNLPAGQIVDDVKCAAEPSQSYALYVPSGYTPDRQWPVIFLFDPGGRGRNGVERYQIAAEQYGFIVAGSNNSRNGQASSPAVTGMSTDVMTRFHIDMKRIYTAGMSGGARVALGVALASSTKVAGVIASSAGYPDGVVRKTVPFPIFATAGTEDFNLSEMRELDRNLTTPHRLAIFEGGHLWLSSALALQAVEFMEIQAMKTGLKPRDEREIDQVFEKHVAVIGAGKDKDAFLALQGLVADFEGLKDVSAFKARAAVLGRDKGVLDAIKNDRDDDERERRVLASVWSAEDRLTIPQQRENALMELRQKWQQLSMQAKGAEDSAERRLARRVLSNLSAGVSTADQDYLKIIREYRIGRGGRGGGQ